jgi:hypothetical protein
MAKLIPLTQGQVAVVCDCHAHLVENKKWYAKYDPDTRSFYAERANTVIEQSLGMGRKTPMHRLINNTPKGFETDHKDHDTLNNQCYNLRPATPHQNTCNRRLRSDSSSGYKGVYWDKRNKKWQAKIGFNGKRKTIGRFDTPELAFEAYCKAAKELHGDFSELVGRYEPGQVRGRA